MMFLIKSVSNLGIEQLYIASSRGKKKTIFCHALGVKSLVSGTKMKIPFHFLFPGYYYIYSVFIVAIWNVIFKFTVVTTFK